MILCRFQRVATRGASTGTAAARAVPAYGPQSPLKAQFFAADEMQNVTPPGAPGAERRAHPRPDAGLPFGPDRLAGWLRRDAQARFKEEAPRVADCHMSRKRVTLIP